MRQIVSQVAIQSASPIFWEPFHLLLLINIGNFDIIGYKKLQEALIMSDERIERILKNTKFTMEMEGFTIDKEQEDTVRKILKCELDKDVYFASIHEKAMRYAHEV